MAGPGTAVVRADARDPGRPADGSMDGNPLESPSPGGPGVVLDQAFALLRFRFARLVGLTATVLLPVQLVALVVSVSDGVGRQVTQDLSLGPAIGLAAAGATWPEELVLLVLRVVCLAWIGMAVGHLVAAWLRGTDASYGEVVGTVARRAWVAPVVCVLGLAVKVVAVGVVGFFFGDALVFTAAVVAGAERLGPWAAVGRSIRLSASAYGLALVVCVGGWVITLVLQTALLLGPLLLVRNLSIPEGWLLVVTQATSLVLLVTTPLTACIAASAYVELRCRVEGMDLRRRAAAQGLGTVAG